MIEGLDWLPLVIAAFFVGVPGLVGCFLVVAALRRWNRFRTITGSGQRATAQVVDNQVQSSSAGQLTFRPVVTFRSGSGQEIRAVLDELGAFRSHLVGSPVEVCYDPEEPSRVVSARPPRGAMIAAVGFGVLFLAFSCAALVIASAVLGVFHQVGSNFPTPDFGFFLHAGAR